MSTLSLLFVVLFCAVTVAIALWLWGERRVHQTRAAGNRMASDLQTKLAAAQETQRHLEERIDRESQSHRATQATWERRQDEWQKEHRSREDELRAAHGEIRSMQQKFESCEQMHQQEQNRCEKLEAALEEEKALAARRAEKLAEVETQMSAARDKLTFLEQAKVQLTEQMKLVANDVLTQSGKQLNAAQQEKLTATLAPLQEKLTSFAKKVEESELQRSKEQGKLGAELDRLLKASTALDKGAQDLTKALRGDNKVAGSWGEVVLERVLEAAGLQEGREYHTQQSEKDEEGARLRPDVVIRLPEQKNLVIDAKVSLKSWVGYATSPTPEAWAAVVASIRSHVQLLSKKNYPSLYGLTSVDFVLMFIPTEPTFLELVRREPGILHDAWNRGVMIIGPSNLQWALRMVASLWKFEDQNQNAQEIAEQAARMYDKFVGFVEDLEKVGSSLNGAVSSYNNARKKLEAGKGDLIGRAQRLKQLGVSPKKSLPERPYRANYVEGLPLLPEPASGQSLADAQGELDTDLVNRTASEG